MVVLLNNLDQPVPAVKPRYPNESAKSAEAPDCAGNPHGRFCG